MIWCMKLLGENSLFTNFKYMTEAVVAVGRILEGMTTNDLVKESVDVRRQCVQLNKRIAEVDGNLAESLKVDVQAVLEREFWPGVCSSVNVEVRDLGLAIAWVSLSVFSSVDVYYGQVDFLDSWREYFSRVGLGEINPEVFQELLAEKFPGWNLKLSYGGMLITGKPWQRYDRFAMSTNVENLLVL